MRDWGSLEILWQDIRQAIRTLRDDPGFTLVALTALTIGIGANTSIFSVVDKVSLEPLPYRDPNSMVQLGRQFPLGVSFTASIPKYMIWRDNDVFSSMALYDLEGPGFNIDNGDFPERLKQSPQSAIARTGFTNPQWKAPSRCHQRWRPHKQLHNILPYVVDYIRQRTTQATAESEDTNISNSRDKRRTLLTVTLMRGCSRFIEDLTIFYGNNNCAIGNMLCSC
jgi:hypothetical protein